VDGEKSLATIHSRQTQLIYQEEEMTLLADTAQMYYREDEQGLHPERLELQGHIKIFSQEKEGPTRRGIADTLTYNPETRICILKALPGQKVLFMRDQDQLRISANEVHITYNPVTKEQEVRGIGHIVLSLSPEEQNLLNQVFHHDSPTP
jgi:lipopolysaccharide export system protein LptA